VALSGRCPARFPKGVPPISAEIGEVLTGRARGRTAERERILVLSLGIAVGDIILAGAVLERARALGRGQRLPL
jgi:ornithine cyclodeaminase/alanine dehydrogenase-like protein (mu-crystallin family)